MVPGDQLTPVMKSKGEGLGGKQPSNALFPAAFMMYTVLPSISLSLISVLL